MKIRDCKYYLIDLDGVILDTSYDNYFWQEHIPKIYAKKNSISHKDGINFTHTLFNYKRGSKEWYDVNYWSNILDIDVIGEKKKQENMSLIKIHPGSLEVLEKLNHLNKELFLVTNAHRRTLDVKLSKFDLSNYFDELICSHELGYIKEDIQFWHLLRNKLGITYEETLLVEDTFENINSAFHAGMSNFIYISEEDENKRNITTINMDSFSELASCI